MSGAVAFVTRELYPFGPGGIGRLVQLLVKQALSEGAERVHLYFASTTEPNRETVTREFGANVSISTFAPSDDALTEARALAAHLAERNDGPLEWVEFPDFRGLGCVAIHEKSLRGDPELRVRIHGANALIAWHEGAPLDAARATEFDLERASLAMADRVIAPLESVRDAVCSFFRLGEDWVDRVTVALPPRPVQADVTARSMKSIVFPTKLQQIKRPDLFVDAGVELLRARPGWKGQLVIAAHRHDAIESDLRGRIPREFAARFSWPEWNESDRQRELAGQVVVVPSDFETLNLAAWEAAGLGARVIASSRCPAFAPGTPWHRWPGFFAFDGSVKSLAEAMGRALESPAPSPFAPPHDPLPRRATNAGVTPGPSQPAPTTRTATGEHHVATGSGTDASNRASRSAQDDRETMEIIAGPFETWLSSLERTSAEWSLISTGGSQAARAFADAARPLLSRAIGVCEFGGTTGGPMRVSAGVARGGALIARTDVLREGLRLGMGPRGLLALVASTGDVAFVFTESDAGPAPAETFPPPQLDVHPFLLRAARPSLRTQLYERARERLSNAVRTIRRRRD